jgi:hypothetical protein
LNTPPSPCGTSQILSTSNRGQPWRRYNSKACGFSIGPFPLSEEVTVDQYNPCVLVIALHPVDGLAARTFFFGNTGCFPPDAHTFCNPLGKEYRHSLTRAPLASSCGSSSIHPTKPARLWNFHSTSTPSAFQHSQLFPVRPLETRS